jgi:hypothetical protein
LVRDEEGTHNTKVDVSEIPTGEALFAPIEASVIVRPSSTTRPGTAGGTSWMRRK